MSASRATLVCSATWLLAGAVACGSAGHGSPGGVALSGAPSAADAGGAPWWTLPAGSRYFARSGRQVPLLLRNATAGSAADFMPLLAAAHAAGAQAIRVQLTQGLGYATLGIDAHGAVLESWAAAWDAVLAAAEQQGLAVVPVFAIWGDWNDGTPAYGWTHFAANPLNTALGGPAATPSDLFVDGETQRDWLAWLSALITRWSGHANVIAWETFSELDLATGADEASATGFAEAAAAVVRAHDPLGRPVFASTSDLPLIQRAPWTSLWQSAGADLVSIHPYDANLDSMTLSRVQAVLAATAKPVFIGESGLDSAAPDGTTLTSSPSAPAGLTQAIWTETVSGAATARALYWEDGYAAYYPQTGLPLVQSMNGLETVAAGWLAQADYTGLAPASLTASPTVFGAALASPSQVRGWVRSTALAPPDWSAPPMPDTVVRVSLPQGAADGAWSVTFTGVTGTTTSGAAQSTGGTLSLTVPGGATSVAFVASR